MPNEAFPRMKRIDPVRPTENVKAGRTVAVRPVGGKNQFHDRHWK